tara:strand:+ start:714 stop:1688 length:975 start_codon:yes stop_codon:yes gene_type:complete
LFPVPENLGSVLPSPERNPLTVDGVELGRALFYDPILSGNNQVSCSSCHKQELAFSDGEQFSTAGVSGNLLLRHTPALINLAWMDGYFWDGGSFDLESQVYGPLEHVDEMHQNLSELEQELADHPYYPQMFLKAFPEDGITIPNLVRALAQFQRTLISADSPYDLHIRQGSGLTSIELLGFDLFKKKKCANCHVPDHFTDYTYRNNGLDDTFPEDHERLAWGRARITLDPADIGKYKVPTLRNVAITAPYMHDARFMTLTQVLDHYRFHLAESDTVDAEFRRDDGSLGIDMTDEERDLIIVFLKALNDDGFMSNTAFSDPEGLQ